jgi:hypothetical protein
MNTLAYIFYIKIFPRALGLEKKKLGSDAQLDP